MNDRPNLHDLIAFVSMETLCDETLELSETVNAHLVDCAACRVRVRDLQVIYDALCREMDRSAAVLMLVQKAHESETQPLAKESKPL